MPWFRNSKASDKSQASKNGFSNASCISSAKRSKILTPLLQLLCRIILTIGTKKMKISIRSSQRTHSQRATQIPSLHFQRKKSRVSCLSPMKRISKVRRRMRASQTRSATRPDSAPTFSPSQVPARTSPGLIFSSQSQLISD